MAGHHGSNRVPDGSGAKASFSLSRPKLDLIFHPRKGSIFHVGSTKEDKGMAGEDDISEVISQTPRMKSAVKMPSPPR
jgi:hypothetical protein